MADDAPDRLARLADDLLPALIARLDASGLGELEVHTEAWRIRLRKPDGPGSQGVAGAPGAVASRPVVDLAWPPGPDRATAAGQVATQAATVTPAPAAMPTAATPAAADAPPAPVPTIATSPAVGYFAPRHGTAAGQRVQRGELLGHVDVLGVREDLLAPVDGRIARVLAQAGEAVEYGQPLVHIDPSEAA